jgi:hypothetical protein
VTRRRKLIVAAFCGVVLLAPGWRAALQPVPHGQILAAVSTAAPGDVFGVSVAGAREGEVWHAQYHGSPFARLLRAAGVRSSLPSLVPPAYAAHIPVGAERADGYYRVAAAAHWPWWRPGGGVDWRDPHGTVEAAPGR